jgi:sugar-specific transcriptional regulator TrmB
LTEETIKNLLKEIGLTDKETEVYIFLSKYGASKGLDVTKRMKKHRSQIYSILKSLQNKGLVELTFEFPARFTAVPLEAAIDLNVKAKREAAELIERSKKDILDYWKIISKPEQQMPQERFVVIDGDNKIYPKIAQMIKETKNELSAILTLRDFLRADQQAVFEAVEEQGKKLPIQCRLITEFSVQNTKTLDGLLKRMPARLNFQGRSPDLGLRLTPRMVIRDTEEILFFLSSEKAGSATENDICLWTNCKALVQSFSNVFEDLWGKSRDLKQKLMEVKTGKMATQRCFVFNPEKVMKKYAVVLGEAKKEVIMLTSAQGLDLWRNSEPLKQFAAKEGGSIKVMAPVLNIKESDVQQALSKRASVRFVTESDFTTILIDEQHLFQFGNPKHTIMPIMLSSFDSYLYTDDIEFVEKTKIMMDEAWQKSTSPRGLSSKSGEKIFSEYNFNVLPYGIRQRIGKNVENRYEEYEEGTVTEKEVIAEMINAKRMPASDPTKDMNTLYASYASVKIHSPSNFNLPDIRINVWHCNKQSSWGAEDWLTIDQRLEAETGNAYVPIVHVTDNSKAAVFRKGVYAKTPAAQNNIVVRKDQLQVRVQGNTLFAGWTIPLPLYPTSLSFPPCGILFEGYGEIKSGKSITIIASGRTQVHKFNRFEASVAFFDLSSKYAETGIQGVFDREHIMTAYPPPTVTKTKLNS